MVLSPRFCHLQKGGGEYLFYRIILGTEVGCLTQCPAHGISEQSSSGNESQG